jgi:GH35 family endo-1,4-beta-xylanase
VPIDGVGFQAHMAIDAELDLEYSREQVRRFPALGLQVQITELDNFVNYDRTGSNDQKLREQAEMA